MHLIVNEFIDLAKEDMVDKYVGAVLPTAVSLQG